MSDRNHAKQVRLLGFAMLVVMLAALLIAALNWARGTKLFQSYMVLIPFMFLGISLVRQDRRSHDYWLGVLWIVWLVASRVLLGDMYFHRSGYEWFSLDCAACLFALPFAWQLEDGQKKHGLYIVSVVLFVVIGLGAWLALFCGISGENMSIPRLGGNFGFEAAGDGTYRLSISVHPNISAALSGLAIMLGVWLLCVSKFRRWLFVPMLVGFAGLYSAFALSMSRTSMIQISLFAAMLLMLLLLRRISAQTKGRWMKIAGSVLLGAAVFVFVFQSSYWIVDGYNAIKRAEMVEQIVEEPAQVEEAKESEEKERTGYIGQRPITADLATMTGRSDIYRQTVRNLLQSPKVLALGNTIPSASMPEDYAHAHNAYLQVAASTGIPGLLMALWFSVRVVWASSRVAICRLKMASAADLVLVCAILAMLVGTIPEVYLFNSVGTSLYNVVFFLLYGYLIETERQLRTA